VYLPNYWKRYCCSNEKFHSMWMELSRLSHHHRILAPCMWPAIAQCTCLLAARFFQDDAPGRPNWGHLHIPVNIATKLQTEQPRNLGLISNPKKTLWPESVSELFRLRPPIIGEVSANFLPIEVCRVVSVADPYGHILRFLDRSLYFFLPISSSIVLTRQSGPRSRLIISQKIW
jgi:hypothetical protein